MSSIFNFLMAIFIIAMVISYNIYGNLSTIQKEQCNSYLISWDQAGKPVGGNALPNLYRSCNMWQSTKFIVTGKTSN